MANIESAPARIRRPNAVVKLEQSNDNIAKLEKAAESFKELLGKNKPFMTEAFDVSQFEALSRLANTLELTGAMATDCSVLILAPLDAMRREAELLEELAKANQEKAELLAELEQARRDLAATGHSDKIAKRGPRAVS